MASVKSALRKRLLKILKERFPPPATVRLEERNGIFGVITANEFHTMDPIDRQELISNIVSKHLTKEESREISIIVAVTPDEETFYLAGKLD